MCLSGDEFIKMKQDKAVVSDRVCMYMSGQHAGGTSGRTKMTFDQSVGFPIYKFKILILTI